MSAPERIQVLYEIALAIGPEEDLETTAMEALSAYLQKLNCSAGAVLQRHTRPDGTSVHEVVAAVPSRPSVNDALEAGIDAIRDGDAAFPTVRAVDDARYYLLELPEFGALVLVKPGEPLPEETVAALGPLDETLANACRQRLVEAQRREERDRFEAAVETIPEPIVGVVFEDGVPIVRRVNPAFEETFGYDEETAVGRDLDELIVPEEADPVEGPASTVREVRRQTATGVGDFLLRSAPVESAGDRPESFRLYVDVSEEMARQRKLERLYEAAQGFLAASSPEEICSTAVAVAEEVLDLSMVGIYLQDRIEGALVPTATTTWVTDVFEGPPTYTDRGSVVWETYRTGEAVAIEDTARFEGSIPGGETPAGSALIFPIRGRGVFVASSLETGAFDDADRYFAGVISTLVGRALDRVERERGLQAVQELTRAAMAGEGREGVARAVVDRVPDAFGVAHATVWEHDDVDGDFRPLASTRGNEAPGRPSISAGRIDRIRGVFDRGDLLTVDGPLVADDVGCRGPAPGTSDGHRGSTLVVPIGEVGVLTLYSRVDDGFTASERDLAGILGSNLETAFELVDRRRELEVLDDVLARILRHNVRNDVNAIRGNARRLQGLDDEALAAAAETIIRRSESLESTADHAREMRTAVARRRQRTAISPCDAAETAAAAVRGDHPDAEIEVDCRDRPEVVAHPDLETAIRHLIENSVRHGADQSGAARVIVTVRETDREVRIEVADDGPGIPEFELEPLDRPGDSDLDHGSGAGLWIVDRIVEYSGGTLEFDAGDDGTTATIRI